MLVRAAPAASRSARDGRSAAALHRDRPARAASRAEHHDAEVAQIDAEIRPDRAHELVVHGVARGVDVLLEALDPNEAFVYEFRPRPGEKLNIALSRPQAIVGATLAPIVPLALTMMSLEELLKKLFGVLF